MVHTLDATNRKTPLRPQLDRELAMRLAAREYDRVVATLDRLTPEQWSAPTDCTDWDVRAMAGHMLGMAQMAAATREMVRQQTASAKRVKRDGGLSIDALTALQVEKNAALTPAELVSELRQVGPQATRARRRTPSFVRNRPMQDQGEWWTLGYLLDVILTRDPFMHRIDIAWATGVPMLASRDHEGVIVDDVVREWGGRHGQEYALELTGPAGGRWGEADGQQITMDAFEFCRAISGRAPASGLLATQVPF